MSKLPVLKLCFINLISRISMPIFPHLEIAVIFCVSVEDLHHMQLLKSRRENLRICKCILRPLLFLVLWVNIDNTCFNIKDHFCCSMRRISILKNNTLLHFLNKIVLLTIEQGLQSLLISYNAVEFKYLRPSAQETLIVENN